MNAMNLAIVFAPTFLMGDSASLQQYLADQRHSNRIAELLITRASDLC